MYSLIVSCYRVSYPIYTSRLSYICCSCMSLTDPNYTLLWMYSTIMAVQQFLWISVVLSLISRHAAAETASLPSSWLVADPRSDIDQAMGMNFMTCTWKSSEQRLTECDNGDSSYGGVTNFDINKVEISVFGFS